jgi:hypothetical protein
LIVIIYIHFKDAFSNSDSTAPNDWVTLNSTVQRRGRNQPRTVVRLLEAPISAAVCKGVIVDKIDVFLKAKLDVGFM